MLCSISGNPPVEAVVSTKSGHCFERRLIEKHLAVTGTCPVTKEELTKDDLLAVKGNPALKPRPPTATSVPGLLSMMQSEWDTLMLETYTLKQHLESTRQELAHALYQHDAACRVIARLIKERDAARANLGNTQENVVAALKKATGGEEGGNLNDVVANMKKIASHLQKGRKKRIKKLSSEVASRDTLKKYSVVASHPLHSSTQPGITCLDIHQTNQDLIVTGGVDSTAILFNKSTGKIQDTLKGHKKRITSVTFHPTENCLITTSHDHTGAIWTANPAGKFEVQHVLKNHTAEVVGSSLHPSGSYVVTASQDKSWCLYDINTGACRTQVTNDKINAGYSSISFHPDGLLLGATTDDQTVRMFDVRSWSNVHNFSDHNAKITSLAFSENGWFLASGDNKGVVQLFDLRSVQKFHTITLKSGKAINNLSFDPSGAYLSVASDSLAVYSSKEWDVVNTWSDHSKDVTSCAFSHGVTFFATTSLDRSLKLYSAA